MTCDLGMRTQSNSLQRGLPIVLAQLRRTCARLRTLSMAALIVTCCADLSAVESQPLLPPNGTPFFRSGGEATYSTDPSRPSTATGGIEARYDGILLTCDNVSLRYAAIPGESASIPSDGDLLPGTAGPANNRVILDTRQATSLTIGFRGLFTPSSVNLRRIIDGTTPTGQAHYHIELPDSGEFQGLLKLPDGWAPYRGWADHLELLVAADLVGGSLTNLRVAKITLHGRLASGDTPARNAEINRLKPGIELPPPGQDVTSEQVAGHNDARIIYIEFDAEGRPGTRWVGKNNLWGDPQLFSLGSLGGGK